MADPAIETDLPGYIGLDQDPLGLVSLLGGEDGVDFRRGDREGAGDRSQLLVIHE